MRFETFERDIRVATDGISQDAIGELLARHAREALRDAIARGEGSPIYDLFVNNRRSSTENGVEAPGPILYRFNWWGDVIETALEELIKASPRRSGKYLSSFVVLSGGRRIVAYDGIPADAEVIITNVQPYTRKVFHGRGFSVPARNFDKARTAGWCAGSLERW